ncbi:uncharacterized protein V6R79_015815 [Siganus canaliculatus]
MAAAVGSMLLGGDLCCTVLICIFLHEEKHLFARSPPPSRWPLIDRQSSQRCVALSRRWFCAGVLTVGSFYWAAMIITIIITIIMFTAVKNEQGDYAAAAGTSHEPEAAAAAIAIDLFTGLNECTGEERRRDGLKEVIVDSEQNASLPGNFDEMLPHDAAVSDPDMKPIATAGGGGGRTLKVVRVADELVEGDHFDWAEKNGTCEFTCEFIIFMFLLSCWQ